MKIPVNEAPAPGDQGEGDSSDTEREQHCGRCRHVMTRRVARLNAMEKSANEMRKEGMRQVCRMLIRRRKVNMILSHVAETSDKEIAKKIRSAACENIKLANALISLLMEYMDYWDDDTDVKS